MNLIQTDTHYTYYEIKAIVDGNIRRYLAHTNKELKEIIDKLIESRDVSEFDVDTKTAWFHMHAGKW